jgi:putative polyhydroxyalkanoate system protein
MSLSAISISRTHSLSAAQATRVADTVVAKLEQEYGIRSQWKGDTLHFQRSGVTGTLDLSAKNKVQVEVRLGFLLTPFRDSIARQIEHNLDEHLAAKPKPVAAKSKRSRDGRK